ncbi:MAG: insulinase family protein [Proteobacteria bacterium]|nr:insulinase family protein [Pseudomonadota bacterium]
MSSFPSRLLTLAVTCTAAAAAPAAAAATPGGSAAPATRHMQHPGGTQGINLAYQRFELPNGLTVVVHEDHKAPVVAVSIWYHIGSADEPAGKTGFAHLFEHLMFSGSENHRGTYFAPFEQAGATDLNGTTWFDRTNYFETVPTTALDMALWMESDRMGHLLGAIGQKELDTQRGVVQNEKRQDENRPYGRTDENILKNIYPANHPYHHDTIGSMADLDAASLADVKQWFRSNYGAANTTLVLAGDITPALARQKALQYFGDIPAGPPVARQQPWITPLARSASAVQHDHVSQTRIIRTWVAPQLGTEDAIALDLATTVLGGGKASRLYQRLVYQDKLADDVVSSIQPFALASQLTIQADVHQGVDPARVDAAIDQELKRLLAEGPSADELERAKVAYRAGFIRQLESVSAQAAVLAEGQVYRGNPGAWQEDQRRAAALTGAAVQAAAARWFGKGDYRLTVLPAGADFDPQAEDARVAGLGPASGRPAAVAVATHEYHTSPSQVDRRSGVPAVTSFPDLTFPPLQRGKLRNGIEVILAERHAIPVTQVQLLFDAGFAADHGRTLGTAAFTTELLRESTQQLDSVEVIRRNERMGAVVGSRCDLDSCVASLNALNEQLAPALALFAQSVRQPAFKEADIERVREQRLAALAQSKTSPQGIALRTLPPLVYGTDNAYGIPFDGLGDEAQLRALGAKEFTAFVHDWLRPDNVRILVVGDITLTRLLPLLDDSFGDWRSPDGAPPAKALATVAAQPRPRLFLVDRPDAPQSLILAGLLAPSSSAPDHLALGLGNEAFGGSFTSRLNMNLREDKHWAYGAGSFMRNAVGQRPFFLYAPVQTDRTAESVAEVLRESRAVIGERPLSAQEIDKVRNNAVRALPGAYETGAAVLMALDGIVTYHRPDDYVQTLKQHLEAVTPAQAQAALAAVIRPQSLTWVVIGDRRKIEEPLRKLEIADVAIMDTDGHVVH